LRAELFGVAFDFAGEGANRGFSRVSHIVPLSAANLMAGRGFGAAAAEEAAPALLAPGEGLDCDPYPKAPPIANAIELKVRGLFVDSAALSSSLRFLAEAGVEAPSGWGRLLPVGVASLVLEVMSRYIRGVKVIEAMWHEHRQQEGQDFTKLKLVEIELP
jgi:hypothetical protein